MHKIIVAKIDEVIEIPNADKIQIGVVLGEQVVISKDIPVGYVGLFCPTELQLSEDFCKHNNLFRDSTKNIDTDKKGFFDDNRRVRAQSFMKFRSQGYFTSFDSVAYTGYAGDFLLGMEFDSLNGHKICQKYISEVMRVKIANNAIKPKKQKVYPFFEKHVDSEQFHYKADYIKKGSLISIHAKVHGCFNHKARVRMWDGTTQRISKINVGDVVLGYSREGVPVPSKVLHTWRNGTDESEWISAKFNRISGTRGNPYYKTTSTANHLFLTPNGYKEIVDIGVGESVICLQPTYVYSSDQIGALIGMYLGDGYLSKSYNMQFCHKKDHTEYLKWKLDLFGAGNANIVDKVSGYGSDVVFTMLPSSFHIRELFQDAQETKDVPNWMVDKATELTLAIIYMDDGSLSHTDNQQDRAAISCCGIPDKGIPNYEKIFNKFDIYPTVFKDKSGYSRMRFSVKESRKLWELITPFIPDIMKYKFPSWWKFPEKLSGIIQGGEGFLPVKTKLLSKEVFSCSFEKYDLHTTTENFVVSNIVVHNSSFRVSKSLEQKELSSFQKFVNRFLPIFKESKYKIVVGSRNVIIGSPEKESFHGSEKFRFEVAEQLEPFLEDGMTVFGEIAGFVNGSPVMPVHDVKALKDKAYTKKYGDKNVYSYGCKEHEYRWHIYRITRQTVNGENIDMSQKEMEKWCEQRGLLTTFEVHPQFIYDGDVDKLRELVDNLTERGGLLAEDYIDSSHIGEGVILRIDTDGHTPYFLKNKTFAHRVMEGHVEVEDMETTS